jgi:hypothetical protein
MSSFPENIIGLSGRYGKCLGFGMVM